ncbi:STM2901 family protein [Erwinia oleae]|uniref:STM2901 family protein n=1 Tax=Erwinia oleae TaxID=796334 RepID=UPI00054DDDA9|nr:hypothetical protein [Erwinia oleae]
MDTVEQLNGTYFYKGISNLSPYELLFWVFVTNVEKQLGVQDLAAITALLLGDNSIDVPGKPMTATPGTSYASVFFRRWLNIRLKRNILPTLTKKSIQHFKFRMVNNLGVFVGRAVPVVGWVVLAKDVSQIVFFTMVEYNRIVSYEHKI